MSLKRQASQQNQFSRHVNFCKAVPDNTTLSVLQLRMQQINKLYEEFEANQNALEETVAFERLDESYVVRVQMEEYYYFCYAKLQECINYLQDQKTKAGGSQAGAGANIKQKDIKLPPVELTPFSGNYEDWTSFRDLFGSLIHSNKNIGNVQKLHYLKGNLKGDAETLIKINPSYGCKLRRSLAETHRQI